MPFRLKLRRLTGRSHIAGIRALLNDQQRLCAGFEQNYSLFFERRAQWIAIHQPNDNPPPKPLNEIIPHPERILVLSPHPDDEVIGCGGTILKYLSTGSAVTVVHITDGSDCAALRGAEPSFRSTARLDEARRVAKYLQIKDLRLWRLPDSLFEVDDELVRKMHELLDELKPDLIFLPFINDLHPDHIKTNHMLYQALQLADNQQDALICFYETWAIVPANAYMATTEYFERKAEALALYPIPMKVVDYIRFCARREAYHHYQFSNNLGFVENFTILDTPAFLKLMKDEE